MRKTGIFVLLVFIGGLFSCESKFEFLEDEKLAAIIADMHISDVAIKRHSEDVKDSLHRLYIEKMEKIHGVTELEMKEQVERLMQDPQKQSEVYTIVIKNLQETEKNMKRKTDKKIKKNI